MAGIYIHIPFCRQKCSYCDFHFSTTFSKYRERMIDAICTELTTRSSYLNGSEVKTIYFGGGTPSLLTTTEITKILDAIKAGFSVVDGPEITLEANPDDITTELLDAWKKGGINRLSIGLQSFKEADLKWMNRAHNKAQALSCVSLSQRAGFQNLTVDLIYGLPGLSMEDWENHIQTVLDFNVPHISAYCLTVEDKTALKSFVDAGKIVPATENQQSEQFEMLVQMLSDNGYQQYEISNFSKPGFESQHNSNYWKGAWYLGVGPSAHSFNGVSRSWNVANNAKYMNGVENDTAYWDIETLTKEDRFNEYILTGLRTVYGVKWDKLTDILPINDAFKSALHEFEEKGWLTQSEDGFQLSIEGRLKADYIASELFIV